MSAGVSRAVTLMHVHYLLLLNLCGCRDQTADGADDSLNTESSDNEGESSTASRKQDEAIVWEEIRESLLAAALLRDAPTTYRSVAHTKWVSYNSTTLSENGWRRKRNP